MVIEPTKSWLSILENWVYSHMAGWKITNLNGKTSDLVISSQAGNRFLEGKWWFSDQTMPPSHTLGWTHGISNINVLF